MSVTQTAFFTYLNHYIKSKCIQIFSSKDARMHHQKALKGPAQAAPIPVFSLPSAWLHLVMLRDSRPFPSDHMDNAKG